MSNVMRISKSVVTILALLTMTVLITTVFAVNTEIPTLGVSSGTVYQGGAVQVKVTLDKPEMISGIQFALYYDKDIFDISENEITINPILGNLDIMLSLDKDKGIIKLIGATTSNIDMIAQIDIITIKMLVKKNAPCGTYSITLSDCYLNRIEEDAYIVTEVLPQIMNGSVGVIQIGSSCNAMNIGDYVQMGEYYDEPILWRCVDIDENGPLMLADKILTIKPFDAVGTHKYLDGTIQTDISNYRANYGSNLWETSNIRSWLNSNATTGSVVWPDGCPPISANVYSRNNDYATEKGFMADGNFTAIERNVMKPVSQKSLLDGVDVAKLLVGGTVEHNLDCDISTVVQNFDNAYYQNVTDKMFLLDVKQVNKVYQNSTILGTNYYIGQPTQRAVENSEYQDNAYLATSENWCYWLRSPVANEANGVRGVKSSGSISSYSANESSVGVRPAFYINLSSVSFKSGSGPLESPLVVDGGPTPPRATDVKITGGAKAGNVLTGSYTYIDQDQNAEQGTTYRWLISDAIDGTYSVITNETSLLYTIKSSDVGKFLKFEVSPRTLVEPTFGEIKLSKAIYVRKLGELLVGDYLQIGTYYDEPILWRCVDIDENGPLMLADKILTIKPFDARGVHKYLDGTTQADTEYGERTICGSNLWETSSMRSWLNSTEMEGNVMWLDGCPPTVDNVTSDPYAYEKGFLANGNFTVSERSAIKSVTQKSLLNGADATKLNMGGSDVHIEDYSISTVVQNYDAAYYQNVTDKMFLLDVKQVNKVYQNSTILGTNYYIGQPTQKAVDNSAYKDWGLTSGSNWIYWLRSPSTYSLGSGRGTFSSGALAPLSVSISSWGSSESLGIRPAFYINPSSILFKPETDGSLSNPYGLQDLSTFCDVVGSTTPTNATIGENTITANVTNANIVVDVTASADATWKLYSDVACTIEIINKIMTLAIGDNAAYIKVTAQDGITTKIYTLTVTRNGVFASSLSAKPGEKAKIDFSICDSKYLTYCEFTVGYSDNSLAIDTTDSNGDGIYDAIAIGDYKVLSHTPIMVDGQDSSKRIITIAVQYDANSGYPPTALLANLCSINFDVKKTSPIGSTPIEIVPNTAEQNNCYGVEKDGSEVILDNPRAGSVNITPQLVTSIEIIGTSSINENRLKSSYTAQILPDYATKKDVTWSVSDSTVASIDESGALTPIINGTLNVIATATDGSGVIGQKTVTISGQKAILSSLIPITGVMDTRFIPYIYNYNVYVPQSATTVVIKTTYTSGILKNNGMIVANNANKTYILSGTTTSVKLDLTQQANLDASTYTINVMKVPDAFVSSDMTIYNGSQRLEAIPHMGGQYNVKATYGNNSTSSNSVYYILTVKSNNRLISVKFVPKTFAPSEVFTFDNLVTLPSKDVSPNLEIKAIIWNDINKISPYSLPLSLYR